MRVLRSLALVFVLTLTTTSFAATVFTGDPFPLTNTRYRAQSGSVPRLVSNGRDVLLFWRTATHFHFRRTDWGDSVPGRAVLEARPDDRFSVVWTGSHFLFVVGRGSSTLDVSDDSIAGQLIHASGELSGEPFPLAAKAKYPALVFDGERVLLFYTDSTREIFLLPLRTDGTPAASAPRALGLTGIVQSAAGNARSLAAVIASGTLVDETWKLVLFDGDDDVVASTGLATDRGAASITANPERYLLAEGQPGLHTRLVELDGSMGRALELEPHAVYAPSVAWTGSKWAIAATPFFAADGHLGSSVVQVDAKNELVEHRDRHPGLHPQVAASGRVAVAWSRASDTVAHAELPLNQTAGRDASVMAAKQEVIATASAAHGTLILWRESGALHGGVRRSDGRWREQVLWTDLSPAAVSTATDGQTFMVVLSERVEWGFTPVVLRLDAEGRPAGEPERLPDREPKAPTPFHAFWTGRDYAVVSPTSIVRDAVGTTAADLAPGPVFNGGEDCALAAGRDGFYAVWLFGGHIGSPSWPPTGVAGIRLGPDFKPLDAMPTVLAGGDGGSGTYFSGVDVAWDGKQYVVTWTTGALTLAHVPANGGAPVVRTVVEPEGERDAMFGAKLTPAADGVAFQWYQLRPHPQPDRVWSATLSRDGTMTPPMAFDVPHDDAIYDSPLIAASSLSAGDVAIVRTARQNDAPVDGSMRLTMQVVSAVPLPERPRAPRVEAVRLGTVVSLRWDAPFERVNGYRVESRIDNQPWVELEGVLPPEQRSVSIPDPAPGRNTSFRVRAWNEAGPGEHSPAVVPEKPSRRRALR